MSIRVLSHLGHRGVSAITEAGIDGVEVIDTPMSGPVPADLTGDVLVTPAKFVANLPELLEVSGVRWVHEFGTGVDSLPLDTLLGGGRVLTCSRGASSIAISEWVLAQMLSFVKQLPAAWIDEPPKAWNISMNLGELHGGTVGLVGLGGIGRRVARLARAFGMEVVAVRRTDAPSPIEGVRITTDLHELLGVADHVVLAAPATAATEHLLDGLAFDAVGPGAHLVNIARGSLIDQDALRVALDHGQVALASLDVCTPEPLPAGHWLYTHPRVHLSPHISWSNPHGLERIMTGFIDNLRRFAAGQPLVDVVDPIERY
ncbi:MAG TPA: NAD(P)-dependent oxidoreductase [Acidimicrobiales bacterium]